MDELEMRLREGLAAARADAPAGDSTVFATVRSGARRRRAVRATLTGSIAVVAVGVVGAGSWGLVGLDRAQQPALPHVSPTATTVPEVDSSADGIAQDDYPALAADRASEVIDYPEAHVMEDWVWDRVGEGWALDVASIQRNIYDEEFVQPAAVLYLVSPEEVYFELYELPDRAWDDARVTSWREGDGVATLWWAHVGGPDDLRVGAGGTVDLRTGELDDLAVTVDDEPGYDYRFVMANAQGDELWKARSSAGEVYVRWSEGADEQQWQPSALAEQEPLATDATSDIGVTGHAVADDGNLVLLRRGDEMGGGGGTSMTLLVYDLAADAVSPHEFTGMEMGVSLMEAVFLDAENLWAWVEYPSDPANSVWDAYPATFQLDGSGRITRIDDDDSWPESPTPELDAMYGRAAPPGAGDELCGC